MTDRARAFGFVAGFMWANFLDHAVGAWASASWQAFALKVIAAALVFGGLWAAWALLTHWFHPIKAQP